jgi:hypothetical protein
VGGVIMTVVVIDFRANRRTGVALSSGADPSLVFPTTPAQISDIPRPCLALWHVGYEQDREEYGELKNQLGCFLAQDHSWVAAYTGGQVPNDLLPNENDHFVLRGDGGYDAAPTGAFEGAIRNVVAHWNKTGGFLPGQLQEQWAGRGVAQADKLSFLMTLRARKELPQGLTQILLKSYPSLESEIQAHHAGDADALKRLQRLFFA